MIGQTAFSLLSEHWAVAAVGEAAGEARLLSGRAHAARALEDVLEIATGLGDSDLELLERVSLAYEVAAVENLDPLLLAFVPEADQAEADVARAGAHHAFEIRRALPLPEDPANRIYFVLHLVALAYAGDRWTDAQRWLSEHAVEVSVDSQGAVWDERILATLYQGWLALLRKSGWEDLTTVALSVQTLREQQKEFEPELLQQDKPLARRAAALRLVALYNWARATEAVGSYLTTGSAGVDGPVETVLDQHFEAATSAAGASGDLRLETLLRWLHVAARQMASGALWSAPNADNPHVAAFIDHLVRSRAMVELLPPQRAALREGGLLDQAARAVVVDMPTSGGKTALAQFRMLQALEFGVTEGGWVAYVAPTRALVAQITRRLRRDFSPLGLRVEALSAAIDIDALETQMLASGANAPAFDVLVLTPEKLDMVVRNGASPRPMALAVIDEAHNIEDPERGLNLELLLATLKRDSAETKFLLLMPYVPNAADLARWLSAPGAGRAISLGTAAWQPNERVVGMFAVEEEPGWGDWSLQFESLVTTQNSVDLVGTYQVGGIRPLAPARSAMNQTLAAGAMAVVMSRRGTSVAVGRRIVDVWSMARETKAALPLIEITDDVALVQRYLSTEVDPQFELIDMLAHGVGVHHAGLSDETRSLMEYLTETEQIKVLCATTSIAQGIDFPISSVFLASRSFPGRAMTPREFWNLAGRAGRIGHDSVGVVGIAAGEDPNGVRQFVAEATGALASRLEGLLDDLWQHGRLGDLRSVVYSDDWRAFRSYVAHLWAQKRNLETVIAETDGLLRSTFGYSALRASTEEGKREQARALREATFLYARDLAEHPENATLADSTGFSPEGVGRALTELAGVPLQADDWAPHSMFGEGTGHLSDLVGVMLQVRELKQLQDIAGRGLEQSQIADIARGWVEGRGIADLARTYFAQGDSPEELTQAISDACRGIYRVLTQAGAWGLAALSKMPTSGIPWDDLSDDDKRRINLLPAMLYHGVSSESGVLMRVNAVPRSVAERLGQHYVDTSGYDPLSADAARHARDFLEHLPAAEWQAVAPAGAALDGDDYMRLWHRLSGVAPRAAS